MNKSFDEKFSLQTNQCSPYDVTSICSCNVELVSEPTDAILHQQSRFWIILDGKAEINIQGRIYDVGEKLSCFYFAISIHKNNKSRETISV